MVQCICSFWLCVCVSKLICHAWSSTHWKYQTLLSSCSVVPLDHFEAGQCDICIMQWNRCLLLLFLCSHYVVCRALLPFCKLITNLWHQLWFFFFNLTLPKVNGKKKTKQMEVWKCRPQLLSHLDFGTAGSQDKSESVCRTSAGWIRQL